MWLAMWRVSSAGTSAFRWVGENGYISPPLHLDEYALVEYSQAIIGPKPQDGFIRIPQCDIANYTCECTHNMRKTGEVIMYIYSINTICGDCT